MSVSIQSSIIQNHLYRRLLERTLQKLVNLNDNAPIEHFCLPSFFCCVRAIHIVFFYLVALFFNRFVLTSLCIRHLQQVICALKAGTRIYLRSVSKNTLQSRLFQKIHPRRNGCLFFLAIDSAKYQAEFCEKQSNSFEVMSRTLIMWTCLSSLPEDFSLCQE